MNRIIKNSSVVFLLLLLISSCKQKEYALGDLTAPSDLSITVDLIGKSVANPNGDGSGDVKFSVTGKNALSYKIDYNANDAVDLVYVPKSGSETATVTKKYAESSPGLYTYRVTLVAYGKGGTSSSITKEFTVFIKFEADPAIVANLTGGATKTWVVDKSVPGHFGVGPWGGSSTPEWWSASVDEKVGCCNCFYTATFAFTKLSNGYQLQVATPDGAFTKTGSLASLPGIPGSGDEGCYAYGGATSAFSFAPASTGIAATTPSTQTSILLSGNTTFIGYGSLKSEYEILVLTSSYMYLRVQGTETGNAWYIKLKAL